MKLKLPILLTIGLCVITYTQSQNLVLDWAISGKSASNGYAAVVVDDTDNVYQAMTYSAGFDADPGSDVFTIPNPSDDSVIIRKLDADGNFIWAKTLSNSSDTILYSMALDDSGNILITGYFSSLLDFDPGPEVFNLSPIASAATSGYVLKLDSDGNFIFVNRTGSQGVNRVFDVATDVNDNVYITGSVGNSGISASRASIIKYNASGAFQWSQVFGGNPFSRGLSIHIDNSNNVIATGYYRGIITIDGVDINTDVPQNPSIYILKLDVDGNLIFGKTMHRDDNGFARCEGMSIVSDSNDNIYTAGFYHNTIDFDPGDGTFFLTGSDGVSNRSGFVQKLDSNGNFVWAKSIPTTNGSLIEANSIVVNSLDEIYVGGRFSGSIDFDSSTDPNNLISNGNNDAYIIKIDSAGDFIWTESLGGNGPEDLKDLYIDINENLYITGRLGGETDFDYSDSTFNLSPEFSSSREAFLVKYSVSTLSVDNFLGLNDILIYPNPVHDILSITSNNPIDTITIYNVLGQNVATYSINTINDNSINVSQVLKGVYLVTVLSGDQTKTFKILKE